jgi:FKBP-type peptidyl-prolyl cis-trans isomerase 2
MTGNQPIPISRGSRVTLHFTLELADGTEVDTSMGGEPHVVTIGSGEFIEALENCLLGLKAGEKGHFEIGAEKAFGLPAEDSVQQLSRDMFPPDLEVEPGQVIGFNTPDGNEVLGTVMAINDNDVWVDFAHPLAGHDLVFDVEILSVEGGVA